MPQGNGEITRLLQEWRGGNEAAMDQLAPAVYDHLHAIAEAYMRGERGGALNTLQATALVHEVFLRLVQNRDVAYENREHFYTFSAKLMRRILVDHARRGLTKKRGENPTTVALAPELAWIDADSPELLDLDSALQELAQLDAFKVQVLELRFFLGATGDETADLLGVSRARVNRDVNFALSWLHNRLKGSGQSTDTSRHLL
ncbi:DNA-directed RNA polymerase sigma-70 factor [Bryobacterales bacterium F-183]|nr:DNA-directed RNA polymerase sigma-70 factor [Bryobacterales bacterium F-183]